jgi:hypothetical protein
MTTNNSWNSPNITDNGQILIGKSGSRPVAATLTPGAGISITNGTGSITINATGSGQAIAITPVSTSPYPVLDSDYFLSVNTSIPITIQLPNAPATGRVLIIKDATGNSQVKNITVTTVGGSVTIDGVTSYLIGNNYKSIQVTFNGTAYEVF